MVKGVDKNNNVIYTDMPNWPTSLKGVVRDGTNRLLGIDNSVWVVRSVPMSPIADAKSSAKKILGGRPLLEAFDNLSYLATNRMGRRSASKSTYRQYQLLTVDTPRWFRAPKGHALEMLYNSSYSELETKSRMCLMAVKLKDSLGNGGWASAMDSVVNTAVYGEAAQMSDFDKDYELVANALDRAGLKDPTTEEILIADSWWNSGEHSDTPFVPHVDHMHVFPTNDSLRVIKEGDDDGRWSLKDCADWPETNSHSITMASVRGLDLDAKDNKTIVESAGAWVSDLIDSGAMVVSLRGLVEPAKVTRGELRRNKKSYQDDIREREREGKMEKTEQEDRFTALNSMESAYAGAGAPATLVDTSIIVGINGKPDGVRSLGGSSIAQLDTMNDRQLRAWSEATLCSRSRSNPNPQDLPSTAVACSGVNGLSNVGDPVKMDTPMIDKSGNAVEGKNISLWSIHAGFTEFDRQDAWLSGTAASDVDKEPLMLVAGTTGSGKRVSLCETLPTPDGYIKVGDVSPGQKLIGRKGKTVTVTSLSEISEDPDLYRMSLSDGQTPVSDYDHQWVVSSHADRNAHRAGKRQAALRNWEQAHEDVATLRRAAAGAADDDESTVVGLLDVISRLDMNDQRWNTKDSLNSALHMMEAPHRVDVTGYTKRGGKVEKSDPRLLFNLHDGLRACIKGWKSHTGSNASRWAGQTKTRIAAAQAILDAGNDSYEVSASDTARLLAEQGAVVSAGTSTESNILKVVRDHGVEIVQGRATVVLDVPEIVEGQREARLYKTGKTLELLALRLEQQYAVSPRNEYAEHRMTTGEILEIMKGDPSQKYAIRIADAVELPEAKLPLSPYTLGAWLGDGFTGHASIIGADPQIIEEVVAEGHKVESSRPNHGNEEEIARVYTFGDSFRKGLRELGFLNRRVNGETVRESKRIPVRYLRGSISQRLSVLQGLMDTDGTINANGNCVLALSDPDLIADALELVRSLGIKASSSVAPAYYTKIDPDTGEKVRVDCKDSTSVCFTTTQKVFRLDRKAARLPVSVRESEKWIYIDSIEPVPSEPSRCLSVDDPDSVYLMGRGFLPTSNTQALLWWAWQGAQMGQPQIILDPKPGSDHTEALENIGAPSGARNVPVLHSELSELSGDNDGIFDPLRFAPTPQAGVDIATSLLLQVNPWGDNRDNFSTTLAKALHIGVSSGDRCVGAALNTARKSEQGDARLQAMVDDVFDLAKSSPTFSSCIGFDNDSTGMRISDGITYINVGAGSLELPTPGQLSFEMNPIQRASLALIRMMIFGSSMALTGRNGVLHADEAWTFLKAGKEEIERLGRLARSQGVLPILYTQRVTDATDQALQNYISRGLILGIRDMDEAEAACELFGLDPTPDRLTRITAGSTKGGSVGEEGGIPNFQSLRPLRDSEGKVIRGSVAIYSDLSGDRANTVEIKIPQWFFSKSSTNTRDQRQRQMFKDSLKTA